MCHCWKKVKFSNCQEFIQIPKDSYKRAEKQNSMFSRPFFLLPNFWNFWKFRNRCSIIINEHFVTVISTFKAILLFIITSTHYKTVWKCAVTIPLRQKYCFTFINSLINLNLKIFSPWQQNLFPRSFNKNNDYKNTNNTSKIITTMISRARIMKIGNILFHKNQARSLQKNFKILSPKPFVTITSTQRCTWDGWAVPGNMLWC